ncbi:MAG: hypothetical protein K2Q32_04710 [Alphaproteobacteria bacterium]|nr:hypothetical protein [Alphaproteobacteria bacterium]
MSYPHQQQMYSKNNRVEHDAGIAIGAILFVVALLGVIAVAMSSGSSSVGSNIAADRVRNDIKIQGNLIRSKILECNQYSSDRGNLPDKYPSSTGTGAGLSTVRSLNCLAFDVAEDASGNAQATTNTPLWTGAHATSLPPTSTGFEEWKYKNAGAVGGRCIRIQPLAANVGDAGIKNGLSQAFSAFTATDEAVYDPNSSSQRFILWITKPTGTTDADCAS